MPSLIVIIIICIYILWLFLIPAAKFRWLTAEFDCVYESRTSYDAACAVLNTAHHGRLVELLTDSDPQHVLTGRAAWEHTVDGLAATHPLTVFTGITVIYSISSGAVDSIASRTAWRCFQRKKRMS